MVVSSQTMQINRNGWVYTLNPMIEMPVVGDNASNTPIRDTRTNISPRKLNACTSIMATFLPLSTENHANMSKPTV